ncbi:MULTISPECIES: hypothetical protein [unclassified Marinomonas]|uniref:hypothetical protein n=1 Tax=unclassified Marinomonas TaxID=196814 RepID=UPI0007AEF798|nr:MULTISPECIES: hypothetical protein [unclassified Marinomonas]
MKTYAQLEQEVAKLCQDIENKPQQRLKVRQDFYLNHGSSTLLDPYNYGDSEIAFLKWEINRGVFNPLNNPIQAGSPWWRNVNLRFIYFSELAGKVFDEKLIQADLPVPVQVWLDYLNEPTAEHWYKAHNTTILNAFEYYLSDAREENDIEQKFLNIILYRLLFAQAMVEDVTIFGELGSLLADPRGFSVKLITSLPDFYPTNYPLTEDDLAIIEGDELSLKEVFFDIIKDWKEKPDLKEIIKDAFQLEDFGVKILDDWIIKPHIKEMYAAAAKYDQAPFLTGYLEEKEPCYPYPIKPQANEITK